MLPFSPWFRAWQLAELELNACFILIIITFHFSVILSLVAKMTTCWEKHQREWSTIRACQMWENCTQYDWESVLKKDISPLLGSSYLKEEKDEISVILDLKNSPFESIKLIKITFSILFWNLLIYFELRNRLLLALLFSVWTVPLKLVHWAYL